MTTFNIDLWEKLRSLRADDTKFLDGKVYFGLAPEDVAAPYCVMHVLNGGSDDSANTLCLDSIQGSANIQFNIYATNDMALDECLDNLNKLIKSFKNLTSYRIKIAKRERTRSAGSFSSEVGMGLTEFSFSYEGL